MLLPLQPHHTSQAQGLIRAVWHEHFDPPGPDGPTPAALRNFMDHPKQLRDLDHLDAFYFANGGTCLGVFDGDTLAGTGALARLDPHTAELRRMFLLPAYRGRGLGRTLAEALLSFARQAGYQRVRLATNRRLNASHRLYEQLGFYAIPPYDNAPSALVLHLQKEL